jgi:methylglutaconyl-CoA hydratase
MFRKILYSVESGIARVTLNRPDKRNALDAEIVTELHQAIAESAADSAVRVVLVSGAGKDFCSGADLAALERVSQYGVLENIADARGMAGVFAAMRRHPRPIVAAVRGRALAGGCGLATACDIVLASESAQFGYPEVNIGFVPAMVMAILRRSMPEKAAFELVATGEIVSATRAREIGMVQRVFSDAAFDAEVEAYAARLASKPPSAMSLTKGLLYQMDGLNFDAALEAGIQGNAIARMTEDCKQGIRRFLDKAPRE